MTSGVYAIPCTANGWQYIGQSQNISKRWQEHQRLLKNRLHPNGLLYRDWQLYGADKFVWAIIEEVPINPKASYQDDLAARVLRERFQMRRRFVERKSHEYNCEEIIKSMTNAGSKIASLMLAAKEVYEELSAMMPQSKTLERLQAVLLACTLD